MGIYMIKLGGGMQEETFLGEKDIQSEMVMGNPIPYRYGEITKPLRFKFALSPLEGLWTDEKRWEVASWLDNGRFSEFFSTDNVDKRYFLKLVGSSSLYTNSLQQGWITVEFENISCYSYSPVNAIIWDESLNASTSTRVFQNLGNEILYPEQMRILMYQDGSIQLRNLSDGGRIFRFDNLVNGEELLIKNDTRHIETSLSGVARYNNFNGNYMKMVRGNNAIEVTGKCEIEYTFRYVFKG